MRNTLKRVSGVYYVNGIKFNSFREALKHLWNR